MKKLIGILVSLTILIIIFLKIDLYRFAQSIKNINLIFFVLSLSFFLPQLLVSAKRWQMILGDIYRINLRESVAQILAGSTLNIVLPSKMGDMAKAFFIKKSGGLELKKGFSLTVIEKALDVGGLSVVLLLSAAFILKGNTAVKFSICFSTLAVAAVFLVFSLNLRRLNPLVSKIEPGKGAGVFLHAWQDVVDAQKKKRITFWGIIFLSLFLWFLHITQIYLFFLSLNSNVPPLFVYTYTSLAIFTGLLPISFGGIGTRDAALIYLFSPYESASTMAAIGLLCSMRYFIPALCGIPFLHRLGFKTEEIKRYKEGTGFTPQSS